MRAERLLTDRGSMPAADRLLQAVAEQIKLPLMHIGRAAELGGKTNLELIETTTERALKFIDGYLLSAQVLTGQVKLPLEPVSLGAVLANTAQSLQKIAKQYGCELKLELNGKYGPVMANRAGLEAALTNLSAAFIEAQTYEEGKRPELILALHNSRSGLVAGVFSESVGLSREALKRARALHGYARQPLVASLPGSAAGIFVADTLLSSMSTKLRVAHHHKLSGLAATFLPSQQLSLV